MRQTVGEIPGFFITDENFPSQSSVWTLNPEKMGYVMHDVAVELASQRSCVISGMTENY